MPGCGALASGAASTVAVTTISGAASDAEDSATEASSETASAMGVGSLRATGNSWASNWWLLAHRSPKVRASVVVLPRFSLRKATPAVYKVAKPDAMEISALKPAAISFEASLALCMFVGAVAVRIMWNVLFSSVPECFVKVYVVVVILFDLAMAFVGATAFVVEGLCAAGVAEVVVVVVRSQRMHAGRPEAAWRIQ